MVKTQCHVYNLLVAVQKDHKVLDGITFDAYY